MQDSPRPPVQPRTIRSVQHAIEVLRHVSKAQSPLGINELARQVGLDKSSVSRLITTLEREGLVEKDAGPMTVRLSLGLVALVAPLLMDMQLSTLVRPRLEQLAKLLGETVNLSVWDGRESVSVVQALGTNAITHYAVPGQRNPAHCTASGKVLLAHAPDADVETVLAGSLERYTDKTVVDGDILRAQLTEIRAAGYALNCREFASDVGAAAAVVRNAGGSIVGAVTATVPMYRFDERRQREILNAVLVATADLSEGLGHRGR